ncbi:TM2 domain-containing protein CG11103-like [Oscarella lobularis]|uniref:TM2 domain-containing protein CG11103-like n=1 Tax=Oscarella lobularis TaxID=121494 RepID=UPI00331416EE
MFFFVWTLFLVPGALSVGFSSNVSASCVGEDCCSDYDGIGPCVLCSMLPSEFLDCNEPTNKNNSDGIGCAKFGGQNFDEVTTTRVYCRVLEGIECYGNRSFWSLHEVPCVKYTGHYFLTTLLYSVLLGFLGVDRFCLGHTYTGIGKLVTIGGVGVWWIVDIILIITGVLMPEDGSNWERYY